ncbi:zincin [Saitoella complicata NRRL Y-17804]|uniref:zincin n=1 Tax=Saitoella complicata (strain BCRC 22490 / CBS 7301 / JCM 7358 / NBRC 10748 / NRRL Y-17804) TaxID=698492 RepID=UPI000867A312|nr:zincin [Saitoella complicata NRRL Y-17804]ODQ51979.1 zincin [Saitoella complicata NRRL Y-17804]
MPSQTRDTAPLLSDGEPRDDRSDAYNDDDTSARGVRIFGYDVSKHSIALTIFIFLTTLAIVFGSIAAGILVGRHGQGKHNPPAPAPAPSQPPKHDKPHKHKGDKSHGADVCMTPECVLTAASILQTVNMSASPCDDFYEFACGNWVASHDIPDDQGSTSEPYLMVEESRRIMREILEGDFSSSTKDGFGFPASDDLVDRQNFEKVQATYKACMNESAVEALGAKPIQDLLTKVILHYPVGVASDGSISANLTEAFLYMSHLSLSPFLELDVGEDSKNPDYNILSVAQPDNGLPSKEYYKDAKVVEMYVDAIAELFQKILDSSIADPDTLKHRYSKIAKAVVDLEDKVAQAGLDFEDLNDEVATYHDMSVQEAAKLVTAIDLERVVKSLAHELPEKIIIRSPEYLQKLEKIISETPKETVQYYLLWKVMEVYSPYLASDIYAPLRGFRNQLQGKDPETKSARWKTCINQVDETVGFLAGRYYVQRQFSQGSKEKAESLVNNVKEAFVDHLRKLDWVDDETKDMSAKKARALVTKIGYPTKSPNLDDPISLAEYYEMLRIEPDEFFGNYLRASHIEFNKDMKKIGKPVDHDRWLMTPYTVNAYYNPPGNELVFPAGILSKPMFDAKYPSYINYGAIGSVIGHETGHAFDNLGRHFDETGKMRDWWSNATVAEFEKRTPCFVNQYSNYSVKGPDGEEVHVNGKLTLGENLADNGGIRAAYNAWKKEQKGLKRKDRDQKLPGIDLTPEQLFYVSFSRFWCGKARPAQAVQQVRTDEHSPRNVRVLAAVANSPEFAKAFGCKKNKDRCELW